MRCTTQNPGDRYVRLSVTIGTNAVMFGATGWAPRPTTSRPTPRTSTPSSSGSWSEACDRPIAVP